MVFRLGEQSLVMHLVRILRFTVCAPVKYHAFNAGGRFTFPMRWGCLQCFLPPHQTPCNRPTPTRLRAGLFFASPTRGKAWARLSLHMFA
jgi:hypothetical protein